MMPPQWLQSKGDRITLTLKDMLRLVCWEVNLFIAFIVFLVLELSWIAPPNIKEQLWQSPGYLIVVGLMSAWILFRVTRFASRIVRGNNQK